ncbi:hypothetical protein CFRS1_v009588 [Colletotrichum fructicola]|nr:hypothetical protein CFRS1_v009588 [Colletotrichum fructicola]
MHATVLQRFAIWYWGRLRDEAELSGATPPDFESARHLLLRRGAPAPSLTEAKDFFRFYIESSKGRIAKNGKPTAESMVGIAEVFYRAFTCETQTDTSVAQRSEVYHWLRHVLTAHRVIEDKKKPKHNLDVVALDRILHVIWSGLNVDHERMRIQLHFILMIYATTGARAGALFAGKVTYRDIELVQKRKPEGDGYFFFFRFDQRFGTTMHEHPVLLHNMEALLEALIFADNALFGLESLEDLWDLDIVPGDNENILRWNEEVLDLPILRKIERDGTVSKEQMSLEVFQRAFRKILDLAGYIDVAASVHQIRRHLGKKIDERYTEVQRSQHITQSDVRIFGASYVANCSSVDGLSAFFGENPDHTAVEFFQGIEKFREQGAPTTLPAASERALWQNGEVVAFEKELTLVKGSSKERQVSSALHSLRRRLRSNALTEYRRNWVRERRDWKVLTRGKVQPALGPVRSNQLTPFIPELERVERLMVSMSKLGKLSMRQAVQDLYSLASKDCTVLYYPGEEPIGGGCRFCGTDLSKIQLRSRSSHTHACNKKHVAAEQRVLPKDMRFCHDCAECHLRRSVALWSHGAPWFDRPTVPGVWLLKAKAQPSV